MKEKKRFKMLSIWGHAFSQHADQQTHHVSVEAAQQAARKKLKQHNANRYRPLWFEFAIFRDNITPETKVYRGYYEASVGHIKWTKIL